MEWGEFSLSAESWTTISMQNSYVSPIVVVSPEYASTSQNRGIGVWLDNVTENTFEVIASNHLGDSTNTITVNYIVLEEGNWSFPGTTSNIEAGKFSTNRVGLAGTGNWECPVNGNRVFFTENFSSNPLVMASRGTYNNPSWGITFQNNLLDETQSPDVDGACIGLSIANNPSSIAFTQYETVYWIAMDEFYTSIDGIEVESLWNLDDSGTSGGSWINGYTNSRPFAQNYAGSWSSTPTGAVVSQTSNVGGEGGWAVLHSLTSSAIRLFIDENIDRSHTNSESGGGFIFEQPYAFGNLPPNSSNLSISPTFTFENDEVLFTLNTSDPQSVFTIKNVTGIVSRPDSIIELVSFENSPPSDEQVISADLELSTRNLSVPPDESIWLDGWDYRKEFFIAGSNVSDLTNYTLRLNVYNKEGTDVGNNVYVGGKANSDYSDIRFTNSLANSSGVLSYWKEREGPDFAIFWVTLDFIAQDPANTSFYMYYGNSSAVSDSNGHETFLYFEDFENYSSTPDDIRPPTWQDYNSGTVLLDTETGGNRVLKKTQNNDPNGGRVNLGLNFSNYELIWKTNRINSLAGQINRYGVSDENANGYSTFSSSFGPSMTYKLERRENGAARQFSPNIIKSFGTEFNTWYILRLSRYEGNFKHFFMDLSETVFETYENFDSTYSNFNTLYIHGGQEYWSDDFLLRKYVEPEPFFTSWGEEKKWKNAIEGETLYETYSFVEDSQIQDLSEINFFINITDVSFDGSTQNSNIFPSLEISLSNAENADWQVIGSLFPATNGVYSLSTTNALLLENWKFEDNRNVRIRGLNMDNFDVNNVDVFEWSDVFVEIDYRETDSSWFYRYNQTNASGIYNISDIIVCDKGNLCTITSYTNASFEITDKGNVSLIFPTDNLKFLDVNQSINFSWNVRTSFVNNTCELYFEGNLIHTTLCESGENVSFIYPVDGRGIYDWNVEAIDGFGNRSFSDTQTFYLIPNISLFLSKEITHVGPNQFQIDVSTAMVSNESFTFTYFDVTRLNYIGGSWSRIYDLIQIISAGTKRLLGWDVSGSENITYSYSPNNQKYNVSDLFIIGLE